MSPSLSFSAMVLSYVSLYAEHTPNATGVVCVATSCPTPIPTLTPTNSVNDSLGPGDPLGFRHEIELPVGTDAWDPCADDPIADNEADDKSPADLNVDAAVNIQDRAIELLNRMQCQVIGACPSLSSWTRSEERFKDLWAWEAPTGCRKKRESKGVDEISGWCRLGSALINDCCQVHCAAGVGVPLGRRNGLWGR